MSTDATPRLIYLDHNATTPLDPAVLAAMMPYLNERFGNASSYHAAGRLARAAMEHARAQVATFLGATPAEVIFTGSGTEADNLALRGVAAATGRRGRHLVIGATEHPAVLRTAADLAADGWEVTCLPVDGEGRVDPAAVRQALRADTVLVSVMAANNETGVIQPVAEIAALAHAAGALMHTDAVQAAGKMPLQVDCLGVDLLSLAGHKVYGPKGTGALYVREGTPLRAGLTGGPQESGRRAGTENVAGVVGLGAALAAATAGDQPHVAGLRQRLVDGVQACLDGVQVHSARAPRLGNTASLSFAGVDGEAVLLHLDLAGIAAATGSACSSESAEPSHVLLAMGVPPRLARGTVRFSLGRGNTAAEIDATIAALAQGVPRLRALGAGL